MCLSREQRYSDVTSHCQALKQDVLPQARANFLSLPRCYCKASTAVSLARSLGVLTKYTLAERSIATESGAGAGAGPQGINHK